MVLGAGVRLEGPREAILHAPRDGTTVKLAGEGAALAGLTIDGSGGRYELFDAAVRVEAPRGLVERVRIVDAVFGILVERTRDAVVRDNEVFGQQETPLGLRGDGIRLWEATGSLVEGNRVVGARDVVVWYSRGNRLAGNEVTDGRYGTHFMFSHGSRVEGNRYLRNVVGVFVMYSRDVAVEGNVVAASAGSAGIGVGLKESGDVVLRDNLLVRNTTGIYVDASPIQLDEHNLYEGNDVRLGQVGVVLHGSEQRNAFRGNAFRDNFRAVDVEGGADALAVEWTGNYFDDYAGFDLDEDGYGDVPFELRSLSGELVTRVPALQFFRGAVALRLVDVAAHVAPLLRPRTLLRDPRPRMAPPEEARRAD